MEILVTYDVSTTTKAGRRRLRKVATICCAFGQRVQKSIFECSLSDVQLHELKTKLLDCINPTEDSLRIYRLPAANQEMIEHYGINEPLDFDEPLLV